MTLIDQLAEEIANSAAWKSGELVSSAEMLEQIAHPAASHNSVWHALRAMTLSGKADCIGEAMAMRFRCRADAGPWLNGTKTKEHFMWGRTHTNEELGLQAHFWSVPV